MVQVIVKPDDVNLILISTALVFFMQCGFAFLEAGTVRLKNLRNILLKNVIDCCAGTIVWWLLGFGFAFGDSASSFIGSNRFSSNAYKNDEEWMFWIFQWSFACTAATIVSGCVAERMKIISYICTSIFMTGWIYPVVVHWAWSDNGFLLTKLSYTDFAGSGVVHMVGGFAGLVSAIILGKRKNLLENPKDFEPSNHSHIVLGTFILWMGWFGFNCGSQFKYDDKDPASSGKAIGKIAVNTTIGASSGAIMAFLLNILEVYIKNKALIKEHGNNAELDNNKYSLPAACNGILAGLVSITAGCDKIHVSGAFAMGLIGGIVYVLSSKLVKKLSIDDPLDAYSVHGACGFWGVIAVGLFADTDKLKGAFYGGAGTFFGNQLASALIIALWSSAFTFILMMPLKLLNLLRTSEASEEIGLDMIYHGKRRSEIQNIIQTELSAKKIMETNQMIEDNIA